MGKACRDKLNSVKELKVDKACWKKFNTGGVFSFMKLC